ncbi:MAG: hypothetical protein C0170_03615 [Hydrogenobaculum sp.]|nr:MAG: hypothetical protein C0170_03615 [Hydrogenobaculum sp.]
MDIDNVNKAKLKEAILYIFYLSGINTKYTSSPDKTILFSILWLFEGIEYIIKAKRPLNLKFIKSQDGIAIEGLEYVLEEISKSLELSELKQNQGFSNVSWIEEVLDMPKLKELSLDETKLLSKLYELVSNNKDNILADITNISHWKKTNINSQLNPIFVLELLTKRKDLTEEEIEEEKNKFREYKKGNRHIYLDEIKEEIKALKNELCYS